MDPDICLKEMLDCAHALQDGEALNPERTAEELATLVIELDHWLVKGGFLPARWGSELREV